jgi:AcrR family transcriptional regulator
MPRSQATNDALREASRTRILDEALRLFADRGYASTPVDLIVKAAGISPGLLYHYFPGKLDVLRAIVAEGMQDVAAAFAAADAAPDPRHRLTALFRANRDILKRRREFWALVFGVRMQREVLAALGPGILASTSEIHRVLERYLRDAGWPNPKEEALLLFAQIDGLHEHYVLDPDTYPIDALIERLVERYRRPPHRAGLTTVRRSLARRRKTGSSTSRRKP